MPPCERVRQVGTRHWGSDAGTSDGRSKRGFSRQPCHTPAQPSPAPLAPRSPPRCRAQGQAGRRGGGAAALAALRGAAQQHHLRPAPALPRQARALPAVHRLLPRRQGALPLLVPRRLLWTCSARLHCLLAGLPAALTSRPSLNSGLKPPEPWPFPLCLLRCRSPPHSFVTSGVLPPSSTTWWQPAGRPASAAMRCSSGC